jgi:hypothetical protein
MKYWDRNSITCKLNIINLDYVIKTCPIECTPKDIEDFKMHIEELLKLRAIREADVRIDLQHSLSEIIQKS